MLHMRTKREIAQADVHAKVDVFAGNAIFGVVLGGINQIVVQIVEVGLKINEAFWRIQQKTLLFSPHSA